MSLVARGPFCSRCAHPVATKSFDGSCGVLACKCPPSSHSPDFVEPERVYCPICETNVHGEEGCSHFGPNARGALSRMMRGPFCWTVRLLSGATQTLRFENERRMFFIRAFHAIGETRELDELDGVTVERIGICTDPQVLVSPCPLPALTGFDWTGMMPPIPPGGAVQIELRNTDSKPLKFCFYMVLSWEV